MRTTTTTHLNLPRARFDGLPLPVAIGVVIFCLLAIAGLVGKIRSEHSAVAAPTPGLIIIVASPLPVQPPTAVPPIQIAAALPANVTRRAIVVYGAADTSTAIGAVEPGRAFNPIAHYGADWMQVDMIGGTGVVFVRTSDLYDVPADLVDLKPAPAPQVVYVSAPAPAYAAPVVEAAPTPAEQQYQAASERQQNIQQHLANEGIPTIAPMEMNPVNQEWAAEQYRSEHP
jgi:hypothetical protein